MIGYVTLGANDIVRAAAFYDKLAAARVTPQAGGFEGVKRRAICAILLT